MIKTIQRLNHETAKDFATRAIIDNLISGNFLPGEQIIDTECAQVLGISRTPFREAELELSRNHLLDIVSKTGTYISYINPEYIEEAIELKIALQNAIFERLATEISPKDIAELKALVVKIKESFENKHYKKTVAFNSQFNILLFKSSGCTLLYEIIEGLLCHFNRLLMLNLKSDFDGQTSREFFNDCDNLVEAIETHDTNKAIEINKRHVGSYYDFLNNAKVRYPFFFKAEK